jgi:hypothetical protein
LPRIDGVLLCTGANPGGVGLVSPKGKRISLRALGLGWMTTDFLAEVITSESLLRFFFLASFIHKATTDKLYFSVFRKKI